MRSKYIALFLAVMTAVCVFAEGPMPASDENIIMGGNFQNARVKFTTEKKGHVAFIGGSITEMNGYRPMVMEILKRRFPETEFVFTDAGISSTCSTTGAFRLQDHVLSKGPVDLFFVEFAVNDDQDAHHAYRECIRGMEGVIRHTRIYNPNADIVMTFFVNPEMMEIWKSGKVPLSASAHTAVAEYYGVPVINLGKETAEQIKAGTMTWKEFGGTHPGVSGNRLCANMIDRLMAKHWDDKPVPAKMVNHDLPKKPLDEKSYFRGRFMDVAQVDLSGGFSNYIPVWKEIKGSFRDRFGNTKLICADKPGAELTMKFDGMAVGAYVLAGPDAGIVETSVDGGEYKKCDLYHSFSRGLHYPRTVMFDADLPEGSHTLKLRISGETKSQGNAVRILHFVAN